MLLRIHPDNPDERKIRQAVKILKQDGLVVIPTDTVYSFACELGSAKGLERIARLKEIPLNKAHFSIACADLSQLSSTPYKFQAGPARIDPDRSEPI